MATTYNPTAAAAQLGISASSLRNWCRDFADLLSDGASPAPGSERKLTDQDIAILLRVKDLRAQGMDTSSIQKALQQEDTTTLHSYIDVAIPPVVEAPTTPVTNQLETPTTGQDAALFPVQIIGALQSMQSQIDGIQQAQETARREAASRLTLLVGGVLIGLGVAALLFLAVSIVSGAG